MTQQITVRVDDSHRPRNIAIGAIVVIVLTYWHFTGSLPLLASAMVPEPANDSLRSTWSFGVELLGDLLYFVGVAATGVFSGLWSLIVALIRFLLNRSETVATSPLAVEQAITQDQLDKRTKQVFRAIEPTLNALSEQVDQLAKKIDSLYQDAEEPEPPPPAPVKQPSPRIRTRRAVAK